MRNMLMAAGMAAVALAGTTASFTPALAQERDECQQQKHQDRNTGTVLGGVTGALAGGLLGHNLTGALVGGAVGAVGGNVIAGARSPKCDDYYRQRGYYYDQQSGYYRPSSNSGYDNRQGAARGYYDRHGRYHYYRTDNTQGYYNNSNGYNNGAYAAPVSGDRRDYDRGYNNNNGYNNNGYNNGQRCGYQDQAYTDAYGNTVHRQVQVCR